MNRTTLPLALAAVLLTGAAQAQAPAAGPVAQPTSRAPAVSSANGNASNSAPAPVVVQTPSAPAAPAPAPTGATQVVYTPQLPNVTDVTNAAAAQGLTVERVVQTANQVVAFYRNANGQPMTVAYQSLPPSSAPAPAANPAPVVVTAPPPTVVYAPAPRVIYYDDYPDYYYYPRVWYPPVSLSFGFGYRSFHGGSFHGGYRGGFHHR